MIVDDSFSRLTTRMIVHDSFSVSCFGNRRPGSGQYFLKCSKFLLRDSVFTSVFTWKELGTRCSRDFARATASELSSTIDSW